VSLGRTACPVVHCSTVERRDYYSDPERYDAEYGPFTIDRAWYLGRAVGLGGPVLELGCGTGRILFALARAGIEVDGIDSSPAMLDRARTRAVMLGPDLAGRIGLHEADLTDFSLKRRYRAILAPLNCLMHLLDDKSFVACLKRVWAQLAPGGQFLFDLAFPQPALLEETGEAGAGAPLRTIQLRGASYLQREHHIYDPETRISRVTYTYGPTACSGQAFSCELALRMYPPAEVARLLGQAGLAIRAHFGDFRENPPDPDCDIMQLYVAEARP
jgi:SAM-dependent methyltransferase